MSGDSKIGIVGGIARTAPVRQIAANNGVPVPTNTSRPATVEAPHAAGLIRLAGELAAQPVPVDAARVEALRGAIAAGRYAADPAKIAGAMLDHLLGSAG